VGISVAFDDATDCRCHRGEFVGGEVNCRHGPDIIGRHLFNKVGRDVLEPALSQLAEVLEPGVSAPVKRIGSHTIGEFPWEWYGSKMKTGVPTYDEIVQRHGLSEVLIGADFQLTASGGLAMTPDGDPKNRR
jgi:hypothetical protein